ncbi:MAG: aminotransferase class I/II-fold pyridoxal phosphate-dependent enzyme [Deltaproteobacteria bacterium]|nr:aminotransferase class I/II-fold pyridoxal phosphate-dependent enzyme [Deltaproteobacteria bacterium]
MNRFPRIDRLPPYLFAMINELTKKARRAGEDIIDLGMGNPDIPTPKPIVDKLIEASKNPKNYRYSVTKGIYKLREAICNWYKRHFGVELDPDNEAVVTIGSKQGLDLLSLSMITPGDVVFVPDPTYPIHTYSVVIAGGDVHSIPLYDLDDFLDRLKKAIKRVWPRPKMIILSFPHNPTTKIADYNFFSEVIKLALEFDIMIIHDLAYADIVFDGYKSLSILEIPEAKKVSIEFFSMSKSYSMPGWRVGFAVGNKEIIRNLVRLKSYFDYGIFQPIQIASIIALNHGDEWAKDIAKTYEKRRDVLVDGFMRIGWQVEKPKATMFVWAKIPEPWDKLGSLEFSKQLLEKAKVAVSPGLGFGELGEGFVRLSLVENEHRIRQAVRGIQKMFKEGIPS